MEINYANAHLDCQKCPPWFGSTVGAGTTGRHLTSLATTVGRIVALAARMGNVAGTDDQLLQFALLAHRLDVLVNVRVGAEHIALDLTLVRATQNPEATILTPPGAPRVDSDLRREGIDSATVSNILS